tara:strand:+ start:440 stop:1102 length:663 start_codon:yes stop_codon:yes gene_type:complete
MGKRNRNKVEKNKKQSPSPLGRGIRIGISLLLLAHLAVVIATPAALVMPGSRLARWLLQGAAPYVQAGNVSHGYAFFAPDPGPGHIIEYELRFADGRKEQGKIPDTRKHWPRLRYHRHFMLTEQLAALWMDEPPPPENPRFDSAWQQDHRRWARQRRDFTARANSYGRHLLQISGAMAVEMNLLRHHLLTPEEFLSGRSLQDRDLYETGEIVTVYAEEQR